MQLVIELCQAKYGHVDQFRQRKGMIRQILFSCRQQNFRCNPYFLSKRYKEHLHLLKLQAVLSAIVIVFLSSVCVC